MSSDRSISLIVIGHSNQRPDRCIDDAHCQLRKLGLPIADARWIPADRQQPIVSDASDETGDSFGPAITRASAPRIVILESGHRLSTAQWQTLTETPADSVHAVFSVTVQTKPIKRVLVWLYCMFVWLFLKTRKHELVPAAVICPGSFTRRRTDQIDGPSGQALTRLLAIARLTGQPTFESVHYLNDRCQDADTRDDYSAANVIHAASRAIRFWYSGLMYRQPPEPASLKPTSGRRWLITSVVCLVATAVVFGNLNYPLFEPDETRNAQLALTLYDSGDWSTLRLHGDYYWDKPPLQTWAIATSYSIFGPSPMSTRLPIAVACLLTLAITCLIGRRLIGFRGSIIATLLLLSTVGFMIAGRYTTMDASLTALTTATFLFGYLAVRRRLDRWRLLLAGVSAGLGLMTKGPIILALCCPPLLVVHWLQQTDHLLPDRRARLWAAIRRSSWFVCPMLLVSVPWYAITGYYYPDFLLQFFWKHNVVRFTDGFNHSAPMYFYLAGIFLFMFPVSYLIPSGLRFATSRKPEHAAVRSPEIGFLLVSIIWIFGFFTLSSTKLPTYVLPAFPLICLLLGAMVDQWIFSSPVQPRTLIQQLVRRVPWELPAWLIGIAIAVYYVLSPPVWVVLGLIVTAVAGGGAMRLTQHINCSSRRTRAQWTSMAAMSIALTVATTHYLIPSLAGDRSDLAAIDQIARQLDPPTVVFFGRDPHMADHTLGKKVIYFNEKQTRQAARFLKSTAPAILVASDDTLKVLKSRGNDDLVVDRIPLGRHVYSVRRSNIIPPSPPATTIANGIPDAKTDYKFW